jgi:hypothetical protein
MFSGQRVGDAKQVAEREKRGTEAALSEVHDNN